MSEKDYRKAKITPETKAESARLLEIWKSSPVKLLQGTFGEEYKIGSQPAVGSFLNGNTPLSLKAARGFARGLKCPIANFSQRLDLLDRGVTDDATDITRLPTRAAAWPLSDELLRFLSKMPSDDLRKIENGLRGQLDMPLLPPQQSLANGK